jgi:hypothetical protein
MSFPNLSLKYKKEESTNTSNTSTNTNTNSNTINNVINLTGENKRDEIIIPKDFSTPAFEILKSPKENSLEVLKSQISPENVKKFKDLFIGFTIEYFKSEIILLNNVLEISSKIVMKAKDLKTLIAVLLEVDESKVNIETEDVIKNSCCGKCSKIPLFKKVVDIYIENLKSFKIYYNPLAVQLQNEYNISFDHVVVI